MGASIASLETEKS